MNLNLLLKKSSQLFLAVLVVGMFVIPTNRATAWDELQGPFISLTGSSTSYDKNWYPDGRMSINPSKDANNLDEILVPVFVQYFRGTDAPIYSFQMTFRYDSRIFEPVGIQTTHPDTTNDQKYLQFTNKDEITATNKNPNPPYSNNFTVAHDFQFTTDIKKDNMFLKYLEIMNPNGDNMYGEAFTVVATSAKPLPNTSRFSFKQSKYLPLFYIRLKVKPVASTSTELLGKNSWFIVDPATVKYNNVNADPSICVEGYKIEKTNEIWKTTPIKRGTLLVNVLKNLGEFGIEMKQLVGNPIRKVSTNANGNVDEYELVDPITVDSGRVSAGYGFRLMQLVNNNANSRITEISLNSNEKWLKFAIKTAPEAEVAASDFANKGYVQYLDNNNLEKLNEPTDLFKKTDKPVPAWLTIKCDPNMIQPINGEMAGKYVGYITFNGQGANSSPSRLKVTFIVLRPAYEPDLYANAQATDTKHTGIRLWINQTDNKLSDSLVFGVAPRATNEVDTLMGERAFLEPRESFEARWYPIDANLALKYPHGFRDALPDYDRPDYNSRDIRSIDDTTEAIKYLCKFSTPKYPLYITWDPSDFPTGSVLYLKDYQTSGQIFSVNMREAAPANNGNKLSYTFTNATLNSFIIEYTLPKVIKFVDEASNPIINKGWNMLSLPVRPSNTKWNVVYPNALSTPLVFVPSVWDRVTEDLKPGQGFFMYYGNIKDTMFSGAKITKITANDKIRIIEGWNLIGALSTPTSVNNVKFVQENANFPKPQEEFTKMYSYWGYKTNSGYYEVNELRPGMGYFIKAGKITPDETRDVQGYLIIDGTTAGKINSDVVVNNKAIAYRNSAVINVMDNEQKASRVYLTSDKNINANKFEMPPVIGDEYFDVRFSNNANLSNDDNSVIKMNGVQYPVSIKVQNSDADLFFYDAVNGNLLGVAPKNSAKGVEVKSTVANAIKVVRGEIEFNAYPNPVTTSAQVKFTVPEAGRVSVKLYDALGNVVKELVDADMNASVQNIDFDANSLSSGSYMLKLTVGSYTVSRTVNIVK